MLYKSLAAGVFAFGLTTFASASLIFTSSYGLTAPPGFLTTIKYTDGKLEIVNNQTDLGLANPSWLEFAGDHIFCVDEVWSPGDVGALFSLQFAKDGTKFTQKKKLETLGGPVSTVRYGQNLKGLAVAA